jgi:hypothetical protein
MSEEVSKKSLKPIAGGTNTSAQTFIVRNRRYQKEKNGLLADLTNC